jgi:hypothetical protein
MPNNDELREGVEKVLAEMRADPELVGYLFGDGPGIVPPDPRTPYELIQQLAAATARVEQTVAAIERVREACAARQAGGFTYIRIVDVRAALDGPTDTEGADRG